jgi:hypothetical protein
MPKHFRASITVTQQFEIDIVARDQAHAERKARELKLVDHEPVTQTILDIKVESITGDNYFEGAAVEHSLFGRGVIMRLHRMADSADSTLHLATIRFENGGAREVILPLPSEKVKIIGINN